MPTRPVSEITDPVTNMPGFNPRYFPGVEEVTCQDPQCEPLQSDCDSGGGGGGNPCQDSSGCSSPAPSRGPAQGDHNQDGLGDGWAEEWGERVNQAITPYMDLDGDGLRNLEEFRWGHIPACLAPVITNCQDLDGDAWTDGAEVTYWDNTANNASLASLQGYGLTFLDPDAGLDTDGDLINNTQDRDSDGDGTWDGQEIAQGTYPEFQDSDCALASGACTPSSQTSFYSAVRSGSPGTGDGANDTAELNAWQTRGLAWTTDHDADGVANALLDPDSDNDGLLDGQELAEPQVRPDLKDTDLDGVNDGDETDWDQDSDADGNVNANDTDADNDGMPDGWEVQHGFAMSNALDAGLDRDGDALSNLGEYLHATDPDDMDTEDDRLNDGAEVTAATDPLHWDTDLDGMPDNFEVQYGLDPLDSDDASQDVDRDAFDLGGDGAVEQPWPNVEEYRYGRPLAYDEAADGPWLLGTNPTNADTDGDGAIDGYEVHYGTNPLVLADGNADEDQDGLNWTLEATRGTDPLDADTDGDGICDGGRASACYLPGFESGFQPGERDYDSQPWATDSDGDGLSDPVEIAAWDAGASGSDQDLDGDLIGGVTDPDSDGDGLEDGHEDSYLHTDMAKADTDNDGLDDGAEVQAQSLPLNRDTDGDLLDDGSEALVHHTNARNPDTDGDGLTDSAELQGATDPTRKDTDSDGMPDLWEVRNALNPRVDDASLDSDGDELNNIAEWHLATNPASADTDADLLMDGYEVTHFLLPRVADAGGDRDGDGLTNFAEFQAQTLPEDSDSDRDGLSDGFETTANMDPLDRDSDLDGLADGTEFNLWNGLGATMWSSNPDSDGLHALLDPDSDNDGLSDRDEFKDTKTKPHVADTDGDRLSDFDEVVTHQGRYDPHKDDTDGDGTDDGEEVSPLDANGDEDQDGLSNGQETAYGTDKWVKDSDADCLQDGPEAVYWGAAWNVGGNRLLDSDVDGDSLLDGFEVGTTGTPPQTFYRTNPALADTDDDGLRDDEEGRNQAEVRCNQPQQAPQSTPTSLGGAPVPAAPAVATTWVDRATGLRYSADQNGVYIQGGYGVRLYVAVPSLDWLTSGLGNVQTVNRGQGRAELQVDPSVPDTDGDGLVDGQEVLVFHSDPLKCDTDGDSLGDGLEAGVSGPAGSRMNPCTHRDLDPATKSDPTRVDSDNDGLPDAATGGPDAWRGEDQNANGRADTQGGVEGDPTKADSDGDGLGDLLEANALGRAQCILKPDCDNDILRDADEASWDVDSDQDTLLNFVDVDSDADGLPDGREGGGTADGANANPDLDGFVNMLDTDADGDYLPDGIEDGLGLLGLDADTDNDGILDGVDINPSRATGLIGLDLDKVLVLDPVDICLLPYICSGKEGQIIVGRVRITTGEDGSGELVDWQDGGMDGVGPGYQRTASKNGRIEDFYAMEGDLKLPQDLRAFGGPELAQTGITLYLWVSSYDLDGGGQRDKLDIGGLPNQASQVIGPDGKDYKMTIKLGQDPITTGFYNLTMNGETDGGPNYDEDDTSLTAKLFERVPGASLGQLLETTCQWRAGTPACRGSPAPI